MKICGINIIKIQLFFIDKSTMKYNLDRLYIY